MDPRLRELERRWQASGTFVDGHAYALALVRARVAPVDLVAEVRAATPERDRSIITRGPEVEAFPLGFELPGRLRLVCVREYMWQYTTITLVFAQVDGVDYLLPPWRARGTLEAIPAILWPVAAEVGADPLEDWRRAIGQAYWTRREPTGLPAAGLVQLDLAPVLLPALATLAQQPNPDELTEWFGFLDILYNQRGYRSQELQRGSVMSADGLPPSLRVHLGDESPAMVERGELRVMRAYVHKVEPMDGWSGRRERLCRCTLAVDPFRWRFEEVELYSAENPGMALT